ncbi:MAG: hypothetical protein L6Q68_02370 [Aquabacterium sp.]|nr:hypothetical protein [Aquabacterium sp.]
MLKLESSGRLADVVREIRDIPERVIPYAAASALNRTAKAAQARIIAEMPRVFASPARYTLGSTRVVPATKQALVARLAVKDSADSGTVPQHYLLPEVEGGARRAKRFELALRYSGIIGADQYVAPGQDGPVDAAGNLSGGDIKRVLSALRGQGAPAAGNKAAKGSASRRKAGGYFTVRTKAGTLLILRRSAAGSQVLMAASRKVPQYRSRLPFAAIAAQVVDAEFPSQFAEAARAIASRRKG